MTRTGVCKQHSVWVCDRESEWYKEKVKYHRYYVFLLISKFTVHT